MSLFGRKKREQALICRLSFDLGFDVGYFGHYETLGWVSRERDKLRKTAKQLRIKARVDVRYKEGKAAGRKQRYEDYTRGLFETAGLKKERRYIPRVLLEREMEEAKAIEHRGVQKLSLRQSLMRPEKLASPSLLERPVKVGEPKRAKLPAFLSHLRELF